METTKRPDIAEAMRRADQAPIVGPHGRPIIYDPKGEVREQTKEEAQKAVEAALFPPVASLTIDKDVTDLTIRGSVARLTINGTVEMLIVNGRVMNLHLAKG